VDFFLGVLVSIPIGFAVNLLTPRIFRYLEMRKGISTLRSREFAQLEYDRIKAFKTGKKDRHAYYLLMAASAVLSAIVASTALLFAILSPFDLPEKVIAALFAVFAGLYCIKLMVDFYQTILQVENFEGYQRKFKNKWGETDCAELNGDHPGQVTRL
jgi:hypothetical protein